MKEIALADFMGTAKGIHPYPTPGTCTYHNCIAEVPIEDDTSYKLNSLPPSVRPTSRPYITPLQGV